MAAYEDFNVQDTKVRDIFRANNPQIPEMAFWIVKERRPDEVILASYDPNHNVETGFTTSRTLTALNTNYTYFRRNPAGGRKRRSRRVRRRRVKRSRRY
jgi:hypothetical protein